VTDRTRQRRCRSRVWQRILHGVYATTSGPLIRPALLTAALPYGMSAVSQPAVPGQYGVLHPGVVVHRSRAYRHIVVSTEPPRTSRADTVLDMAVAEPTAQQVGGSPA